MADGFHGDSVRHEKFGGEPLIFADSVDQRTFDFAEAVGDDLRLIEDDASRLLAVPMGEFPVRHGKAVEFPLFVQRHAGMRVLIYNSGCIQIEVRLAVGVDEKLRGNVDSRILSRTEYEVAEIPVRRGIPARAFGAHFACGKTVELGNLLRRVAQIEIAFQRGLGGLRRVAFFGKVVCKAEKVVRGGLQIVQHVLHDVGGADRAAERITRLAVFLQKCRHFRRDGKRQAVGKRKFDAVLFPDRFQTVAVVEAADAASQGAAFQFHHVEIVVEAEFVKLFHPIH